MEIRKKLEHLLFGLVLHVLIVIGMMYFINLLFFHKAFSEYGH